MLKAYIMDLVCIKNSHKSKTQGEKLDANFKTMQQISDYIESLLDLMYNPPTLSIRRIRSKVSQGLELKLAKGIEQELSKNRALEQL